MTLYIGILFLAVFFIAGMYHSRHDIDIEEELED